MKFAPLPLVTALGLCCLLVPSCNPADPSAIQESKKTLDETMAKNTHLTDEITGLKNQLDQTKADLEKAKSERDAALAKPAKVEETKMPSSAEVEARLDQEVLKLKEEAKQKNPGSKVEGLSTWDVTSPGEDPYSCKAKVALTDPKGTRRTLYWTGAANLKGEWKFKPADNLETKPVEQPTAQPPEPPKNVANNDDKKEEPKEVVKKPDDKKPDDKKPGADDGFKPPTLTVVKDGDKRGLKDQQKQPERSPQTTAPDKPKQPDRSPQTTAPEKPKQKFDIDLKNPVMGPGSK